MKKNKPSWDDIPSLDEVGVDWEFKPTTPLGKRAFIRVKIEDLAKLFSTSKILVKVATVKQTYNGHLFDISPVHIRSRNCLGCWCRLGYSLCRQ